jgi:hypothetical protein
MLWAKAHADEPRRDAAEHGKPVEELDYKRRLRLPLEPEGSVRLSALLLGADTWDG